MAFPNIPPAGVTPIGTTDLTTFRPLPSPPVIRADKIRYRKQQFESLTKDRDPVDAAVIEALWRVRGSGAAVTNTGSRFQDIEKINSQAATTIEAEARTALHRIIRRGDIIIQKITVLTGPDFAEITVAYINQRAPFNRERLLKKRVPEEIIS